MIDARTGQPLGGVLVTADPSAQTIATRADGAFAFPSLPAGLHTLSCSLVGYALVKRDVEIANGQTTEVTVPLPEGAATYAEAVTVTADVFARPAPGVPTQQTLGSADIQALRGVLADDPMRAVQAMPGVATGDDFRSEFMVRGSDFRHIGVSIDDVPTSLLLHLMPGIEDTGSIAMINSDVLESITLFGGSHPQPHGNHTGAQVDFRLRPGSRDRRTVRAALSATNASAVAEGTIGRGHRGSWLLSGRLSYLPWVLNRVAPDLDATFGFTDMQGKAVYDLSPHHQIDLVAIGGVTTLTRVEGGRSVNSMFDGFNRTGMVSTGSRVAFDRPWTLSQRLWLVANEYRTFNRAGQRLDTGTENELGYRADVTAMPFPAASVTAGASVQRVRSDGRVYLYDTPAAGRITLDAYTGARWISSAHVQLRVAHRTTTVTSGARVDWWTPIGRVAASPWVQLDARVARWRLAAGGGIYRQPPTVEVVDGPRGTHDLREEHAWHAEIGIEREISTHVRWRATTYDREERDGLRLPDSEDRLDESGRLIRRSTTTRWQQPLEGSARGVELLLQRSALDGLSGWVAYTYGRARYHDRSTGETFDANADQRHTLNLQASYRFGSRTSFGVKFRAGSNIPVAGYYRQEGDQFFLAAERNTLRLPHYSRLDLRAARTFAAGSRRLTLFVEVLNVYNRRNYGPQGVNVNRRTLEATGLVEELLPILPSAGLSIEF